MKSFEEISKMNLAELDRPVGVGEEELETETTGAAGNHSVSDAEKAGTPGADDLETSINMSAAVSDNEEEKQPEEIEKKVMMEPQGKHLPFWAYVSSAFDDSCHCFSNCMADCRYR